MSFPSPVFVPRTLCYPTKLLNYIQPVTAKLIRNWGPRSAPSAVHMVCPQEQAGKQLRCYLHSASRPEGQECPAALPRGWGQRRGFLFAPPRASFNCPSKGGFHPKPQRRLLEHSLIKRPLLERRAYLGAYL